EIIKSPHTSPMVVRPPQAFLQSQTLKVTVQLLPRIIKLKKQAQSQVIGSLCVIRFYHFSIGN
ncbi:MAG TPA: hypothetical protein VIK89_15480, partial [Cytophagaceae bacterium]